MDRCVPPLTKRKVGGGEEDVDGGSLLVSWTFWRKDLSTKHRTRYYHSPKYTPAPDGKKSIPFVNSEPTKKT